MKKLTTIIFCVLFVISMAGSVFAIEYSLDFLEAANPGGMATGLKTFDRVNPERVVPGNTFAVDIWACDMPESILSSGFLMEYDPSQVSIINVQAYDGVDIVGPWDGFFSFKQPDISGPGSYMLALLQLNCAVPDAGGDVILARVTFQCMATGNAAISVQSITIPNFETTVGCNSGFDYDSQMAPILIDVYQQPWWCLLNPGDPNYCFVCGSCGEGIGDCDNDAECGEGLVCKQDVGSYYGWGQYIDVCEQPDWCPLASGHPDYCLTCGPCGEGIGDCDSDAECGEGLVCKQDVGAYYGWGQYIDVCEQPDWCPVDPGDPNYCLTCGPCGEGIGDCDSDAECGEGLVCKQDVGAYYGWGQYIDVCEQPEWCPLEPGDPNYCLACGPCVQGFGDCDSDAECGEGLVCKQDVGSYYGWGQYIDVCQQADWCPLASGHPDYCITCGPCVQGFGDCDSDDECGEGLVCKQDVGAYYGWSTLIDVCEIP